MELFDWATAASIDIDCQRSFTPLCPNELPVPDGHNIVAAVNAQAKLAKWRIGSMDFHPPDALWIASEEHPQLSPIEGYPNLDLYWNAHCIVGTEGAKLLPGLPNVEDYDFMVFKGLAPTVHPYGACFRDLSESVSTGLIEFLQEKKITTVILAGLALDYCVKTTAIQLMKTECFRVIVNINACRAIGDPEAAIAEMRAFGIEVVNV